MRESLAYWHHFGHPGHETKWCRSFCMASRQGWLHVRGILSHATSQTPCPELPDSTSPCHAMVATLGHSESGDCPCCGTICRACDLQL